MQTASISFLAEAFPGIWTILRNGLLVVTSVILTIYAPERCGFIAFLGKSDSDHVNKIGKPSHGVGNSSLCQRGSLATAILAVRSYSLGLEKCRYMVRGGMPRIRAA